MIYVLSLAAVGDTRDSQAADLGAKHPDDRALQYLTRKGGAKAQGDNREVVKR